MATITRSTINYIAGKTSGLWSVATTVESDLEGVQYLQHEVPSLYGIARVEVYSETDAAVIVGGTCYGVSCTPEMSAEFKARGLGSIFEPVVSA